MFSQTSAPSLFFFYFTPTLTLLCLRPQLWPNYPSCWKMFMCCALVFVSCPSLSLSLLPNFYEHHLESQIPSFSGFVYFLLHLIKDFESYLRSWISNYLAWCSMVCYTCQLVEHWIWFLNNYEMFQPKKTWK